MSNDSNDSPGRNRSEYWQALRRSYIHKNSLLYGADVSSDGAFYFCDARDFYNFIFPEGFLETPGCQLDWDEPGGGHPNAIVIEITNDKVAARTKGGKEVERRVAHRHMLTDGCGEVGSIIDGSLDENTSVFVAPVSYFGKARYAKNARFLHAFTIDLDGVGEQQLANLLKQIRNGHELAAPAINALPQPSAIVNSGTGLHLYYVLDEPVPLRPSIIPFLQQVKHCLVDMCWTSWTSTLDERQYQGIYQSFRMVGTPTKLNGEGRDAKLVNKYTVTAFRYEEGGEPWKVSLDYLLKFIEVHVDGKAMREIEKLRNTGGKVPIERAKELWPEWYQRRIVDGKAPGRWHCNRAVYDWWLKQISDPQQVTYHHRYWCIRELAAYADKCGIPIEELEEDAYGLVQLYDTLTEEPNNHFTSDDVTAALEGYGDGEIHKHSIDGIERRTKIAIPKNKRNGRKQVVHLHRIRAAQRADDEYSGTDWRDGNGRRPKRDLVRAFAAEHPGMSHSQMARELGVSRPTVIKWLKNDMEQEKCNE